MLIYRNVFLFFTSFQTIFWMCHRRRAMRLMTPEIAHRHFDYITVGSVTLSFRYAFDYSNACCFVVKFEIHTNFCYFSFFQLMSMLMWLGWPVYECMYHGIQSTGGIWSIKPPFSALDKIAAITAYSIPSRLWGVIFFLCVCYVPKQYHSHVNDIVVVYVFTFAARCIYENCDNMAMRQGDMGGRLATHHYSL